MLHRGVQKYMPRTWEHSTGVAGDCQRLGPETLRNQKSKGPIS